MLPHWSKQGRCTRKLDGHYELFIIAMIHENPSLYLYVRYPRLYTMLQVWWCLHGSTVCRVLRRNGFTRKKVQQVAKKRCIEFRTAFMAHVLEFPREYFVGADETGSDARTHIRQFRCLACPWFIHARKANLSNRRNFFFRFAWSWVDMHSDTTSVDSDKLFDWFYPRHLNSQYAMAQTANNCGHSSNFPAIIYTEDIGAQSCTGEDNLNSSERCSCMSTESYIAISYQPRFHVFRLFSLFLMLAKRKKRWKKQQQQQQQQQQQKKKLGNLGKKWGTSLNRTL